MAKYNLISKTHEKTKPNLIFENLKGYRPLPGEVISTYPLTDYIESLEDKRTDKRTKDDSYILRFAFSSFQVDKVDHEIILNKGKLESKLIVTATKIPEF